MTSSALRGQRISRQELIEESRKVLAAAGVGNRARAKFITEVSSLVIGSQDPIYTQLQPRIIQHDSPAWIKAFALLFQYLNDHNLTETISAIENEFGQGPLPAEVLADQGIDSDRQFNELLACIPKEEPFKKRVRAFFEEKKSKKKEAPKPAPKSKAKSSAKKRKVVKKPKENLVSPIVRSSSPNREEQAAIGKFINLEVEETPLSESQSQNQEEPENTVNDVPAIETPVKVDPVVSPRRSPTREESPAIGKFMQFSESEDSKKTARRSVRKTGSVKKKAVVNTKSRVQETPKSVYEKQGDSPVVNEQKPIENKPKKYVDEIPEDFVIDEVIPAKKTK